MFSAGIDTVDTVEAKLGVTTSAKTVTGWGKTYNLKIKPRLARSSGDRPIDPNMMVAVTRPGEWSVYDSSWHTAPAMRTAQRTLVYIQPADL